MKPKVLYCCGSEEEARVVVSKFRIDTLGYFPPHTLAVTLSARIAWSVIVFFKFKEREAHSRKQRFNRTITCLLINENEEKINPKVGGYFSKALY